MKGKMMDTLICQLNEQNINHQWVRKAGAILAGGGLVAFPTETVYGLGADALNDAAAAKIYLAKGRPSDNPLIVHIAEIEALTEVALDVPPGAYQLAKAFWPGPLTMILNKSDRIPLSTTGGLDTVAVRMPSNPLALAIIKESGTYIAAPSANISGKPSPTSAGHVIDDLNGKVDMIIDGGTVAIGIESTIIDLTGSIPMILRPGMITREMLSFVLGEVAVDAAIATPEASGRGSPKAPGMKYKHYAPAGELILIEGDETAVIKNINQLVREREEEGFKTGVIATDETLAAYHCQNKISMGSRLDYKTIAHHLYDTLRTFDALDVDYIYCESFNGKDAWQAIMNRLLKAAGYQLISV